MTSTYLNKEKNTVSFTMEFTAEEFDAATNKVYLRDRAKITIDGFRKGKAPRSIIEKKYGAGVFFEEAVDDLLNAEYKNALDANNIDPVSRPSIDFGEDKLEKGKGFKVIVKVDVAPEITVKDYKGIKTDRLVHTPTEEDVAKDLEDMQKKHSRQINVEGAAENGDTVVLDYAGFCGDNQFEGGTAEKQTLKLGSNTFIPGFEEQLVGIKPGEDRDVKVTFPAEYHEESLAGKDAIFKCKVHEIKREELPALDDEFAKDASEFDTLEELKADVKKRLDEVARQGKEYSGKEAVVAKLMELNPVELPAGMIDMEAEQMLEEYAQQLSYSGISFEDFLKYTKRTVEQVKEELKPEATKRATSRMLLSQLAKQENLEATEAEIEEEFKKMADQYKMELAKIKDTFGPDNMKLLKEDIANNKAIQFLYDNAEFTDVEEEKK